MTSKKRKSVSHKDKLWLFVRDNFTCKICGRSPVTCPGLALDIDHIIPFSKGGTDDLSNLQTCCQQCNRSKGASKELNRTAKHELRALLNNVNPKILETVFSNGEARIVANQEDFSEIEKINSLGNFYQITIIPNTIMGNGAGKNFGIYTVRDSGGAKTNFHIKPTCGNLTAGL